MDSIKQVIDAEKEPIKRLFLLDSLVSTLRYYDISMTLPLIEQGLKLAKENKEDSLSVNLNMYLASCYLQQDKIDAAVTILQHNLKKAKVISNHLYAKIHLRLGYAYEKTKAKQTAMLHYDIGLKMARKIGNRSLEAAYLNNMAIIDGKIGNNEESLKKFSLPYTF